MGYIDPRDNKEDETILTESSEDELLDLQKEYEAKRIKLLEKKRAEKERRNKGTSQEAIRALEVSRSRSPSPERPASGSLGEEPTRPGAVGNKLGVIRNRDKVIELDMEHPNIALRDDRSEMGSGMSQKQQGSQKSARFHQSGVFSGSSSRSRPATGNSFALGLQATSKKAASNSSSGSGSFNPLEREFSFESIPAQSNIIIEEPNEDRDPYSSIHLRKRYYPKEEIDRMFKDKKALTTDKFFAKVYPPLFTEPQYSNWMLVGMVLFKSETKFTNDKNKSKYMKISVGNFHNISVDVLLFKDSYTKYWKLQVGDVISILNPVIKPYRVSLNSNSASNQADKSPKGFNLVLDDSCDTIIEIGSARDFGFCKSIKKDGHRCSTPINTKRTDYCNFHQELAIRKTGSKRMELNGSITMKSPSKSDGTKQAMYMRGGGVRNGGGGGSGGHSGGQAGEIMTDYSQYKHQPDPNLYYSGKAFFRDEYTNPKILENLTEKRRKLQDSRSDEALQKKLSNIKSSASLRSLGLSKPRGTVATKTSKNGATESEFTTTTSTTATGTSASAVSVEKIAFNPKIISKIGFNPAANSIAYDEGVYKSPTKRRKLLSENLQELYELSNSNASKKLTSSMEDRLGKKKKWSANVSNMKQYKDTQAGGGSRLEQSPFISSGASGTLSGTLSGTVGKITARDTELKLENGSPKQANVNTNTKGLTLALDSDSDSDIEIEFNNEAERRKYSSLARK